MEPTQSSETSAFITQTPGKYPEDRFSSIKYNSLRSNNMFVVSPSFLQSVVLLHEAILPRKYNIFIRNNHFQSNFSANRILPALICFGRERGWRIICNYPTVLKETNIEKQKEYNLRYLLAKVRTT
jgi:hypothetical protein